MPRAFRWSVTSGARRQTLDAIRLVTNLRAWLHGERDRMRVVRAPSAQDEASRQLIRDRGQLHKEVLQHRERMRKLLVTLGCWDEVDHRSFARRLAAGQLACHDGTPLPDELRERLQRETARLELAEQQLATLERTLEQRLRRSFAIVSFRCSISCVRDESCSLRSATCVLRSSSNAA